MYWLMVKCSMSDSVLAAKKKALGKRGLLSDIGCFSLTDLDVYGTKGDEALTR